jgi:hypothetical protein
MIDSIFQGDNTENLTLNNFINFNVEIVLYKKVNDLYIYKLTTTTTNIGKGISASSSQYFNLNKKYEKFWSNTNGIYNDTASSATKIYLRKSEMILEKINTNLNLLSFPNKDNGLDSKNIKHNSIRNKNIENNSITSTKLDFHRIQGYWEMSEIIPDTDILGGIAISLSGPIDTDTYQTLPNLNKNYPNLYLNLIGNTSASNNNYLEINKTYTYPNGYTRYIDQISIPNLPNTNDYLLEDGDYIEHTYEIATDIFYNKVPSATFDVDGKYRHRIGIGPFAILPQSDNQNVFKLGIYSQNNTAAEYLKEGTILDPRCHICH